MLPTRTLPAVVFLLLAATTTGTAVSPPAAPGSPTPSVVRSTGPTRPLYLVGFNLTSGKNEIRTIQNGGVANAWDSQGSTLPFPFTGHETAVAVSTDVRTVGNTNCSPCNTGGYTATYQLDGTSVGSTALSDLPLVSPTQYDQLYDGTTDGTNNYAVGVLSSHVYSFDADWTHPQVLFTLPAAPGGGLWLGISYDASNDSLWASTHNSFLTVANFAKDGTLLSSFIPQASYNLMTGLALDNEDGTIWMVRENTLSTFAVQLEQYSRTGTLLAVVDDPAFQNFDTSGAEFPLSTPKTPQSITVTQSAPASAVFGTSFSVAATATSGLIVDVSASGACALSGGAVAMTSGTGDCTVTYTQPGDAVYAPATPVVETTAAVKAGQVIQVTQSAPSSATFTATFGIAANAPGGAVTMAVSGVCSLNTGTVTMTAGTGTCTTTFDQAGNANHLAASQIVQATTALKASQSITIVQGAPPTATFKTMVQLIATAPGGPVAIAASGACSVKSGILTMKKATPKVSVCTVSYNQGGNTNYAAAPPVVQTTTVQ